MKFDEGINLDFSKLEKNICDVIKEEQIKLGYRKETIRLYYPLLTLNRFLNTDLDAEGMLVVLNEFETAVVKNLGDIEISNEKERFCFCLPPKASEYIHLNTSNTGFLYDFIGTVSKHGVSIEEIITQFKKYSDNVVVEKKNHGEFDYLIYFKDGIPDEFRYCLTQEGCHMIYHRFTIDDYNDFHFEE